MQLNKAESWNDQYFTDLEAEVEAEGKYYLTALQKRIGKASEGLRKARSLIRAIDDSAERCLVLTGDPGSGKSVALRHLAMQLARRAAQSSNPSTRVPLYINLKELPSLHGAEPTADFIRDFIVQNIRRGDADTADYVKEKWGAYREHGIWFFLFDSFDEIPEVLHAPTESPVVQQHAEAIRQFLEGMGDCRGVLASREYKGPNTLAWPKVRILPLTAERQDRLIANSFLDHHHKTSVQLHLASEGMRLRHSPMFLTLLCRYVKDHDGAAPPNDHALLEGHIERLAGRDPEHTRKRYKLTPYQLLEGAETLAILFAENPQLSLAPTQDEIAANLEPSQVPGGDIEALLAALVDVKIARADVAEARQGDQRFTFAHRRYQETLFVRKLAREPSYIPSLELLSRSEWREYAVTLLQTQPLEILKPIFHAAEILLAEYAQFFEPTAIRPEFGGHLHYWQWKLDRSTELLRLLQEGLVCRLDIVPATLSEAVDRFLSRCWIEGDDIDRENVIRYGGLMPQHQLSQRLEELFSAAAAGLAEPAIGSFQFVRSPGTSLTQCIRLRVADELISAQNKTQLLQAETLCMRLPHAVVNSTLISRWRRLHKYVRCVSFLRDEKDTISSLFRELMVMGLMLSFLSAWIAILANRTLIAALVGVMAFILILLPGISYKFRTRAVNTSIWRAILNSRPDPGAIMKIVALMFTRLFLAGTPPLAVYLIFNSLGTHIKTYLIAVSVCAALGFLGYWGTAKLRCNPRLKLSLQTTTVGALIGAVAIAVVYPLIASDPYKLIVFAIILNSSAVLSVALDTLYGKILARRFSDSEDATPMMLRVESVMQLFALFNLADKTLFPSTQMARSFLRLLRTFPAFDSHHRVFSQPLFAIKPPLSAADLRSARAAVLKKIRRLTLADQP